MKKLFVISFLAVLCMASCDKDDKYGWYSYNEPTIYSSSDKVVFSEIVLFMKPYVMDGGVKKYIVMDTLPNVSIKINNKSITQSNSYGLDVEHLNDKTISGNYMVTSEPVSYPVVVNVLLYPDEFVTAGQYADLLNNYLSLSPGTYVLQIESFDVKTSASELKTIYTPALAMPLEVKENQASVNLGEFEILVNN